MPKRKQKTPAKDAAIILPELADILVADELLEQMMQMDVSQGAVVDIGKVERMSTPIVQLLIALDKSIQAAKGRMQVAGASVAVDEAFATLGLQAQLNAWKEA